MRWFNLNDLGSLQPSLGGRSGLLQLDLLLRCAAVVFDGAGPVTLRHNLLHEHALVDVKGAVLRVNRGLFAC